MTITIEKYLSKINTLRGKCAFRGQADSKWKLHSAATRRLIKHSGHENIIQGTLFSETYISYHRDVLIEPARTNGFGIDDGHEISDLQLLAKLQHFGAATGLLDFTWDPLVALWFACEQDDCDGKVFAIDLNDPAKFQRIFSNTENQGLEETFLPQGNPAKQLYWEPITHGEATPRVLRQRSVFVIGRPVVPENLAKIIEISASDKAQLRKELKDIFDIDELSLFKDVHGFAIANDAEASILRMDDPNYYLFQANQFYQQGDYDEAINCYDDCVRLVPDVSELYFLRGNAKAEKKDYHSAKLDYDLAVANQHRPYFSMRSQTNIRFNPNLHYPVYFNRGNVKSELEDYEGALEDYTEAINLYPQEWGKRSDFFFNRANTKAMLHRFEDAINDYNQAIHLGSREAYFNKGNVLVISGRFSEALSCYDEIIKKEPENSAAGNNRDAVKAILDRIKDSVFQSHFSPENMSIEVSVLALVDKQVFVFQGSTGNAGNQGGNGLRGGKGFGGKKGFIVILKRTKTN